jgi:RNA polymerase sigma-70 factor (TIGR02943 family)
MAKQLETVTELTDPATWVDRHGDYLFRYAMARVRGAELAEDLVQEAFLGALRSRHQFAGASSERTWLVSILKRKIIDHLRRQHREEPASNVAADGWMEELFDRKGHWKKAPARWPSPSAVLENAEFWKTFSHCLEKLPGRQADAFSLREIDELASAEVCEVLAISPANLWVMLHRARLQLWRCLDIHWFGGKGSER